METIILFAFTLFYGIFGLRNPPPPGQWLLVLNQDTTSGGYFAPNIANTGIQNKDNPQSNAFSIVGGLDKNDFLYNGAYQFRLVYGGLSESFDKTWAQTSWLMDSTITGSTLGDYDANEPYKFYGLGLSDHGLLDGNGRKHDNWWHAAGTTRAFNGGIPALRECSVDVLNTWSRYFDFEMEALDGILGRKNWNDEQLELSNGRTIKVFRYDPFGQPNGLSYGRYDPRDSAKEGDWSVGDRVTFTNECAVNRRVAESVRVYVCTGPACDRHAERIECPLDENNALACPMKISISACEEWQHESNSDALKMRLIGTEGKSNYFSVNEAGALPIKGETEEFLIPSSLHDGIGALYGIELIVEDDDGYCISKVEVDTLGYWAAHGAYGHESFNVNGANLDPECKSPTTTEHDQSGKLDWVTGNIGYQCCSLDGSDNANRHGCTRDQAYTHEEALANCAADNKRLCTMEEVEDKKGRGTGCHFDVTLVWTSSPCKRTINFNQNYFGNGVLLKPVCDRSFIDMNPEKPLYPCMQSGLELFSTQPRGIYDVSIHTCDLDDAGLSTKNMQESLYLSLQGKTSKSSGYESTAIQYLDHFVSNDLHLESLGDKAINIQRNGNNLEFYPNTEMVGMRMVGLKFEGKAGHPLDTSYFTGTSISIHPFGVAKNNPSVEIVGGGAYALLSYDDEIQVDRSAQIKLSSVTYPYQLKVYIIVKENVADYSLPFVVDSSAKTMNWFDAEQYCQDTHGTSLLSIHSEDEMKVIRLMMHGLNPQHGSYWIGFNDQRKEGQWEWSDMSAVEYTNWKPGQPSNGVKVGGEDCGELKPYGVWNDLQCNLLRRPLCNNPTWPKDTTRTFQINSAMRAYEVISVAIGNNNDDDICIDAVTVDEEDATLITENKISSGSTNIMMAVFKYPVCESEVIAVTLDMDSAKIDMSETSNIGIECKNYNPSVTQECGAGQTFEASTSQTFSYERGEGYSYGSSSSISYGTSVSQSTTTSDEFSWGMEQSLTVGAETEVGIFGQKVTFSAEIGFSSNQQWTSTREESTETTRSREEGTERSQERESWKTNQDETGKQATYTAECSGTVQVPPEHSIQTMLTMTTLNTTVNTFTDIRLTRCNAFISPDAPRTPADYIYIKNIPGTIGQVETTQCEVSFQPAQYLGPQLTCWEYQQLAISLGLTYTPDCQPKPNQDLFEPCQCDSGNTLTMTQCWCVSETGDKNGDMRAASGDETPEDVCRVLNCQQTERRRILVSEGEETKLNDLRNVAIGSLVAVVLCIVVILYYALLSTVDKDFELVDDGNSVHV